MAGRKGIGGTLRRCRPAPWLAVAGFLLAAQAAAAPAPAPLRSRSFTTSDGVRLHYLEAGDPRRQTILFVPGWTMPAWIWRAQLDAFAPRYHVVAIDPRGQGRSDIAATGYNHVRRGRDLAELLPRIADRPAVLVGWSLGVLDALAYVHLEGDARVAALVLVDNSIGEEPAPRPSPPPPGEVRPRGVCTRAFVAGMFRKPPPPGYVDRLAQECGRLPARHSAALLAYPVPRTYWREAVYATRKPVLYVVRPPWQAQAKNLAARHPNAEIMLFPTAGHALFVDEPARFNAALEDFLRRKLDGAAR